jgi:hypothetical protein
MLDLSRFLFGEQKIVGLQATRSRKAAGFVDFEINSSSDGGVQVRTTIDAGDRLRRGIRVETESGREIRLTPLERLWLDSESQFSLNQVTTNSKYVEHPSSYVDSFVAQIRLIKENQFDFLHKVADSLELSRVVDRLEAVSSDL